MLMKQYKISLNDQNYTVTEGKFAQFPIAKPTPSSERVKAKQLSQLTPITAQAPPKHPTPTGDVPFRCHPKGCECVRDSETRYQRQR